MLAESHTKIFRNTEAYLFSLKHLHEYISLFQGKLTITLILYNFFSLKVTVIYFSITLDRFALLCQHT